LNRPAIGDMARPSTPELAALPRDVVCALGSWLPPEALTLCGRVSRAWRSAFAPTSALTWRGARIDYFVSSGQLLAWACAQIPRFPWSERVTAAAAAGGHHQTLRWARAQRQPCPWGVSAGAAAAAGGHLEILKWIEIEYRCLADSCPAGRRCPASDGSFARCPAAGRCPVSGLRGWKYGAFTAAAANGRFAALEWIGFRLRNVDTGEACAAAARAGRLDVLRWFALRFLMPTVGGAAACAAAAEGGHLEVLKWLRAQSDPCIWDASTCAGAAWGGHLEALRWARAQEPPCLKSIKSGCVA
jgi:hypothetical protein